MRQPPRLEPPLNALRSRSLKPPPNRLLKQDLLPAPQDLDKERLNKPNTSTDKESAERAKKQPRNLNADDDVEFDDPSLDLSDPSKTLSGGEEPGSEVGSASLNVEEDLSLSSKEAHQSPSSLDT